MLIEVQKIVHCLRKMQSPDSEQYDQHLQQICQDQTYLYHLRNILADDTIEEPTRKMACVFFKNYFIERYTDFDEVFFVEIVMALVLDERINYKIKVLLQDTIVNMLEWVEQENLVEIIDCIEHTFFCLQRATGKEFLSLQKKNIAKKSNMDETKLNLSKFCNFSLQTEDQFTNLSYSVIHLVECFSSAQNMEAEHLHRVVRISLTSSLTIFPIKKTQIYLRLQMVILHMWLGYMEKIDEHKERNGHMGVIEQQIFEEEYLWSKIVESYELEAFNLTGVEGEQKLLVCSPENPQKKIVNKIKSYACQVHLKLLQYESHSQKVRCINRTTSSEMFTQILKTLSYFSLHKHMLSACVCESFVNSLLTLFIEITSQNKQIIDTNWTNILHMIVFPLLTIDEKEFLSFDQDPEEFCRLAEDCCDKQHLGELKTEAARLLEHISDRNMTYCQYAVQFCCLSIQSALFKGENIIENPASLLPLQTALMITAILSYNLTRFPAELSSIKSILLTPQCQQITQIEASRVFLFLAYNYSEVFATPLEGKPWIHFALSANHHTTKIIAMDFLLNVVDEYFEDEFLLIFSNKLTDDTEVRQIWNVLNKLLNHHLNRVHGTTLMVLIQKIFQRMSEDIVRYKDKKIKTTANVNSGLQLLRKILIATRSFTAHRQQVQNEILKLATQYKIFKELNLEDHILKIINEFIAFNDTISQEFMKNFAQIDLIEEFRDENYRPTPFYWIWNQFIFKERNFEKVREIKDILVEGLENLYQQFLSNKAKTKCNLPMGHSLLVLQHMLVLHGQKLTSQQIYKIYDLCVKLVPEDINEPERLNFSAPILGRALIVLMLCYMLAVENEKMDMKQPMNPLKYLLLYHDEEGVFEGHNASVIVKLLCKGLFKETDLVSVTEMINIMVRVIRPKKKQQKGKKGKQKASTKFRIKSTQNYEAILKKIVTPFEFKSSAEQQLRNTLITMKQNNEPLYKSVLSYLPTSIKDKLRDIVATNQLSNLKEGGKSRRIVRVGGIRSEIGYSAKYEEEDEKQPGKRVKNFQSFNEDQVYAEVDENQLNDEETLEKGNESDDEPEERKVKAKKMKKTKKLKANELPEKQPKNI